MKKYKNVVLTIAIILFVSALPISTYDFYSILRWVVCGASIFIAYENYNLDKKINYFCIAIAILFNPIYPFYMEKESWIVFDLISGGYYIYLYNKIK
ncbi:MAG: hypothetical protein Q4E75_01710 [bacterium]|nr:hypothetical protein [bacterium]